jgi:hypothetical protein
MNGVVMDAQILLALFTKAQTVFEREGTFLSFPITPPTYSPSDLSVLNGKVSSGDDLRRLSEFSHLVNLIPDGIVWPPSNERYLWEVYGQVLRDARLAEASRTDAEEEQYQEARRFLHVTRGDGSLDDTAEVKAYQQYRDALFVAEEEYLNLKSTAESSDDGATRQRWSDVEEPQLRAQMKSLEDRWISCGFRHQVEAARQTEAALGAKSPTGTWAEWRRQFNPDIDLLTDTENRSFARIGFAPANVLQLQQWQTFVLTEREAEEMLIRASTELKERLSDGRFDLDIDSLTFEYTSVRVSREWLNPAMFDARFWQFDDSSQFLSDGFLLANGLLPAYVAGLVLVRNIMVIPKPSERPTEPARTTHDRWIDGTLDVLTLASTALGAVDAGRADHEPTDGSRKPEKHRGSGSFLENVLGTMGTLAQAAAQPDVGSAATDLTGLLMPDLLARLKQRQAQGPDRLPDVHRTLARPAGADSQRPTAGSDAISILAFICRRLKRCPDPDPWLHW